ncbi:hypothetical protein BESB_027850 [Besnoitia besnoiti]|uniref:RNA-editing substrate-binding complex 6 protein domain-containing protein n=1 Tax=Besnoitia besnoiti TaxID=94643 RepID=A0A2A9M7I0_BESBE|nr:uncharacterized protein BESB_027850 [Besnoitia besnoiti]PFH31350.1 hypothetical protein BESB_027850 [Besnoitia besnoiti]
MALQAARPRHFCFLCHSCASRLAFPPRPASSASFLASCSPENSPFPARKDAAEDFASSTRLGSCCSPRRSASSPGASSAASSPASSLACSLPSALPQTPHFYLSLHSPRAGRLPLGPPPSRALLASLPLSSFALNVRSAALSSAPSPSRPSSCEALIASLPTLGPQQVAPAARKLLHEGVLDAHVWRHVSRRTSDICEEMTVEQIGLLLRVYALRQLQDFNLFSQLSARLVAIAQAGSGGEPPSSPFRGVDLVNILVACGKLLFSDKQLHALLAKQLPHVLSELRPKDLVNIAHAYSKLRIVDEELFRLVARALPPYVYDLTPIALANVCTSYASVGLYEGKLFDAVTAEAERRITEFGGCELLSLLLGLSRMQAALPQDKKRRDSRCVAAILRALRGRMGPFGFVQNLQVLESLILLGHYDSLFIHTKVLPALLARRPSPPGSANASKSHGSAADAASAATADAVLGLYLRVLCCLYRLPSLSHTGLQLLQEIAEQLPRCFQKTQVAGMAVAIHLLSKLDCHDYDCFSKAEALLLADRVAALRQLRFAHVLQLRDAFRAFGDDEHWAEVLKFLDGLVLETQALLDEARQQDSQGTAGMPADQRTLHARSQPVGDLELGRETGSSACLDERESGWTRRTEADRQSPGAVCDDAGSADATKPRGTPKRQSVRLDSHDAREAAGDPLRTLEIRPQAASLQRKMEAVVHAHQYSPDGEYTSRPVLLNKHVKLKNRGPGVVKID